MPKRQTIDLEPKVLFSRHNAKRTSNSTLTIAPPALLSLKLEKEKQDSNICRFQGRKSWKCRLCICWSIVCFAQKGRVKVMPQTSFDAELRCSHCTRSLGNRQSYLARLPLLKVSDFLENQHYSCYGRPRTVMSTQEQYKTSCADRSKEASALLGIHVKGSVDGSCLDCPVDEIVKHKLESNESLRRTGVEVRVNS